MSRIKVMFLGLLAIFAVGAVASASASAHEWLVCHLVTVNSEFKSLAECEGTGTGGTEKWDKKILAGESVEVHSHGGAQTLTATGGIEIKCSSVEDLADLFPAGADLVLHLFYHGCAVVKPTGCGYVSSPSQGNGLILATNLPSQLVEPEPGVLDDEISENTTAKEFVTLDIETAEGSGSPCGTLKLTQKVTGSVLGKVNNATETLEFTGKSGAKKLKIGVIEAQYSGNDKQEGGDKITAD